MGIRIGFAVVVGVALATAIGACDAATAGAGGAAAAVTSDASVGAPHRGDGGVGGQDPKTTVGAGGPHTSGAGW